MSEQLQNKLYNYHAQPSIEVWNKIDSSLEEDSEKKLAEKLTNYQTHCIYVEDLSPENRKSEREM